MIFLRRVVEQQLEIQKIIYKYTYLLKVTVVPGDA